MALLACQLWKENHWIRLRHTEIAGTLKRGNTLTIKNGSWCPSVWLNLLLVFMDGFLVRWRRYTTWKTTFSAMARPSLDLGRRGDLHLFEAWLCWVRTLGRRLDIGWERSSLGDGGGEVRTGRRRFLSEMGCCFSGVGRMLRRFRVFKRWVQKRSWESLEGGIELLWWEREWNHWSWCSVLLFLRPFWFLIKWETCVLSLPLTSLGLSCLSKDAASQCHRLQMCGHSTSRHAEILLCDNIHDSWDGGDLHIHQVSYHGICIYLLRLPCEIWLSIDPRLAEKKVTSMVINCVVSPTDETLEI